MLIRNVGVRDVGGVLYGDFSVELFVTFAERLSLLGFH